MHRHTALISCLIITALIALPAHAFDIEWGNGWDTESLQDVLDARYGPGVVDAQTQYEGYDPADAVIPYWEDAGIEGILVREIGAHSHLNTFGWYKETFTMPVIDGLSDGQIFEGHASTDAYRVVTFPEGTINFGFWLNPRGPGDTPNAPEPEIFFTNRFFNDVGPDGGGTVHGGPGDGDPQCLIYNLTDFYDGVPTFVLAWEDLDYGSPFSDEPMDGFTDGDFQDMVVEIQAFSPVPNADTSWGQVKALYRD